MNAINSKPSSHAEDTGRANRSRELYVEQRWEMYELASGIGIRDKATFRKVAHVAPGPHDLDAARLIEAAPQLLDELESILRQFDDGSNAPGFRAAREAVARARGQA